MIANREGLPQMQPRSIALFSRIFLASLVLTAVLSVFDFPALKAALVRQDPGAASLGDGVMVLVFGLALAVMLVLWFLIARQGSNIAKWVLVALTVIGFGLTLPDYFAAFRHVRLISTLSLLAALGQLIAIAFLFRADARAWLGREQSPDLADIG